MKQSYKRLRTIDYIVYIYKNIDNAFFELIQLQNLQQNMHQSM